MAIFLLDFLYDTNWNFSFMIALYVSMRILVMLLDDECEGSPSIQSEGTVTVGF